MIEIVALSPGRDVQIEGGQRGTVQFSAVPADDDELDVMVRQRPEHLVGLELSHHRERQPGRVRSVRTAGLPP